MSEFESDRIIRRIEIRAEKLKIPIAELCRSANIARSTFQRWKRGETSPSLANLESIDLVLKKREG